MFGGKTFMRKYESDPKLTNESPYHMIAHEISKFETCWISSNNSGYPAKISKQHDQIISMLEGSINVMTFWI